MAEHEVETFFHGSFINLDVLAQVDLVPEAVLVETVAPRLSGAPASADYVERIARPARELGFPDWYVQRIESFA